GGEKLDQVGALLLALTYERAQRVWTAALQRVERREDARTRQSLRRDPLAQVGILGRARALDRREAGPQRGRRVCGGRENGLHGRVAVARRVVAALTIEVPRQVRVGVNEARQHGARAEVNQPGVGGERSARTDLRDLATLNEDVGVGKLLAASINNARRADDRGRVLRQGGRTG